MNQLRLQNIGPWLANFSIWAQPEHRQYGGIAPHAIGAPDGADTWLIASSRENFDENSAMGLEKPDYFL
jgi:hypothetical protein